MVHERGINMPQCEGDRREVAVIPAPRETDRGVYVGERPGEIKIDMELAVDPERVGRAALQKDIRGQSEADAEYLDMEFAVQLNPAADLDRGPLNGDQGGDVGVDAQTEDVVVPRLPVAGPRPGNQPCVADDEIRV